MSRALSAPPAAPTISADTAASGMERPKSLCAAPNTTAERPSIGADRQVDAAGDDHRRERHGQQPELHAEPGDLEEVADGEKVRRNDGEERDLREDSEDQPPFAIRKQARQRRHVYCGGAIRRALPRQPGACEWPVDPAMRRSRRLQG